MGMTEMRKAPTDAEQMARHEADEAKRARRTNAASLIDNATRTSPYTRKSLSQVKRSKLAGIALALGYAPRSSDTRTFLVLLIEREMAA